MKATRVFQVTALALVVVAAVQVGWWLFDQRSQAIEKVRDSRALYSQQILAAQALLDSGATPEKVRSMLPGIAINGPDGKVHLCDLTTGKELHAFEAAEKLDLITFTADGKSLIMRARKTWSCDFHKDGRPGSVMLYPSDGDKSATTIDLIYEVASNIDPNLLEPKEEFDVIGPGQPGEVAPMAQNESQDKAKQNEKAKRN